MLPPPPHHRPIDSIAKQGILAQVSLSVSRRSLLYIEFFCFIACSGSGSDGVPITSCMGVLFGFAFVLCTGGYPVPGGYAPPGTSSRRSRFPLARLPFAGCHSLESCWPRLWPACLPVPIDAAPRPPPLCVVRLQPLPLVSPCLWLAWVGTLVSVQPVLQCLDACLLHSTRLSALSFVALLTYRRCCVCTVWPLILSPPPSVSCCHWQRPTVARWSLCLAATATATSTRTRSTNTSTSGSSRQVAWAALSQHWQPRSALSFFPTDCSASLGCDAMPGLQATQVQRVQDGLQAA